MKRTAFFGIVTLFMLATLSAQAQTDGPRYLPSAADGACRQWVDSVLQGMTLRERIGQLFIYTIAPQQTAANRELLRRVVETGRGMEVNTYRGKSIEEWRDLLTLYRSLGGELITVGADAHIPQSVGKGIPQAYELIRETGFRYITVYQGRKPHMLPLN